MTRPRWPGVAGALLIARVTCWSARSPTFDSGRLTPVATGAISPAVAVTSGIVQMLTPEGMFAPVPYHHVSIGTGARHEADIVFHQTAIFLGDRPPFVEDLAAAGDSFAAEETRTSDAVPVNVDAVLFWTVYDAEKAALEVQDYSQAVSWAAQTALRDIIGRNGHASLRALKLI